jgi:hypothetical protein
MLFCPCLHGQQSHLSFLRASASEAAHGNCSLKIEPPARTQGRNAFLTSLAMKMTLPSLLRESVCYQRQVSCHSIPDLIYQGRMLCLLTCFGSTGHSLGYYSLTQEVAAGITAMFGVTEATAPPGWNPQLPSLHSWPT